MMKALLLMVVFATLLQFSMTKTSNVVQLDQTNFQNLTQVRFKKCCQEHHASQHTDNWFVLFYAKECDHCEELFPIWNHLAQQLHNSTMKFGSVNCDVNKQLCESALIDAFPTLLLFKADGKAYKFTGHRNQSNLQEFIEGSYQGTPSLDFKHPGVIEQTINAINSLGTVGTLLFATIFATFFYLCFTEIFKERSPKNIKIRESVRPASGINVDKPSATSSKATDSPGRSKRD